MNKNNNDFREPCLLKPSDALIYKENLNALKKRYPKYAELIEKTEIGKNYIAVTTGTKQKFNVYCVENNIFYYDQEDPDKDIKQQMELLGIKNARIALFLGFGLGYEVDYFAKFLSKAEGTQFIFIVEKDIELFKIALTYINYTPMIYAKNIKILLGETPEDLFTCFESTYRANNNILYFLKCIQPIYHESSIKINNDYYMGALNALRKSVVYMLDFFGNDPHDSLIGFDNIIDNIDEIVKNPGISLLFNKFKGKPAIIVSTGPSLNKNKHLLKNLQDKAFIICPDASLKILLDMGVRPHLVTALERVEASVKLITGFTKEQVEDVYYAATPVVLRDCYRNYPGPRLIVYRNYDHFRWLGIDKGICDIKQSSGNMAFKLASEMGCDPIILIGQDLAYSRDGSTHASGAIYGENQVPLGTKTIEVPGNDGRPILTNETWNLFKQGYEIDIAASKSACINSTEGGAYIHGTLVMPFEESIKKYIGDKIYPVDLIKQQLSKFSAGNISNDTYTLLNVIDKTIEDIKKMMEYCIDGLDAIKDKKELYEKIVNGDSIEYIPDLDKQVIENLKYKNMVFNTQPTMQLFLMHIVQSFTINFEIDINAIKGEDEDKVKVNAKIILMYMKWYAVMHDVMAICLRSLEKAKDRVIDVSKDIENAGADNV